MTNARSCLLVFKNNNQIEYSMIETELTPVSFTLSFESLSKQKTWHARVLFL